MLNTFLCSHVFDWLGFSVSSKGGGGRNKDKEGGGGRMKMGIKRRRKGKEGRRNG